MVRSEDDVLVVRRRRRLPSVTVERDTFAETIRVARFDVGDATHLAQCVVYSNVANVALVVVKRDTLRMCPYAARATDTHITHHKSAMVTGGRVVANHSVAGTVRDVRDVVHLSLRLVRSQVPNGVHMLRIYHSPERPNVVALVSSGGQKTVHFGIVPMQRLTTAISLLSPRHIVCMTTTPHAFEKIPNVTFGTSAAVPDILRACVILFRDVCFDVNIRFPNDYTWMPFRVEEWMTWIDWSAL